MCSSDTHTHAHTYTHTHSFQAAALGAQAGDVFSNAEEAIAEVIEDDEAAVSAMSKASCNKQAVETGASGCRHQCVLCVFCLQFD